MRCDLKEELAIPSHVRQLTAFGAAQRKPAEDKWPGMEGEFLFPSVALLADKLDGFELVEPPFGYGDAGKTGANCG